ncbi:hypothetical protein [Mycobacterium simiae]|nr:hypothetical protein [Mycobacterium simiae]
MRRGIFGTPIVPAVNGVAAKLIDAPLLGSLVRRNTVMISYVGRYRRGEEAERLMRLTSPKPSVPETDAPAAIDLPDEPSGHI